MSMKQAFERVLDTELDGYNAPQYWDICGVKVQFKPVTMGVPALDWRETLEEWLPKFEQAGWLTNFHKISIGEDTVRGGVGRYMDTGAIYLENSVDLGAGKAMTLGDSREYILTHEMVHHAHINLNGYSGGRRASGNTAMLKEDVSWYAGTNINESIAEIGAGIIHGEGFPDWVYEYYEAKDGPQEAYDIG